MILSNGSRFEIDSSSCIRTDKQRAAPNVCCVAMSNFIICRRCSAIQATLLSGKRYKNAQTSKQPWAQWREFLSRTVALPARQVSGMRVGDLRAPTRTDAPPEPAVGFCESGNSSSFSFSRHTIFSASPPPTVGRELRCFSFRIGEVMRIITLVNKRES